MTEKWGVKPRKWAIEARLDQLWQYEEDREISRQVYKDIEIYDTAVLTDGYTELIVDESKVNEFLASLNEFGNLWQKK